MISGVDDASVIAGGKENKIFGGNKNFVGAGATNVITGDSNDGIIIGGTNNKINSCDASTIVGGLQNTIDNSNVAFCVGGTHTIGPNAGFSAILGGGGNKIGYNAFNSVILGGVFNVNSGQYSMAGGQKALIPSGFVGATVLADGQGRDHISSGSHTATFDFASGVYVPSTGFFNGLHVSGVPVSTGSAAEADTLQTVTDRGATTTNSITVGSTLDVADSIRHAGDTDTRLDFSADQVKIVSNGITRLQTENAGVIINEGGVSADFRVEGDTDTHALFVDGSTDNVGIGIATPAKKFHVEGESQLIGDTHVSGDLSINHTSFTTYQTGKIFVNNANQFQINYGTREVLRATTSSTKIFGPTTNTFVDAGSSDVELKVVLGGQLKINAYYADDDLAFYSHGGNKILSVDTDASANSFVVGSNSNVGIGLSNPTHKLVVSGDVGGTGNGGRITLNGTGYLLSGEAAET